MYPMSNCFEALFKVKLTAELGWYRLGPVIVVSNKA